MMRDLEASAVRPGATPDKAEEPRRLTSDNKNKERDDDDFVLFSTTATEENDKNRSHNETTVDDDMFLTALSTPTEAPSTVPLELPTHSSSSSKKEGLLDVSVIVVWCFVVLFALYYLRTEQQRRRRLLRRQRQERLEQYSPKKQAQRMLELTQILKATTMTVSAEDLVVVCHHGAPETEGSESSQSRDQGGEDHVQVTSTVDMENDIVNQRIGTNGTTNETTSARHHPEASYRDIAHNNQQQEEEEDRDLENGEVQHLFHYSDHHQSILEHSSSSSWRSEESADEVLWTLKLPITTTYSDIADVTQRHVEVPAKCCICLRRYRVNDVVSWSPSNRQHRSVSPTQPRNSLPSICPHAFHQQCIVAWLAKLPDCSCPVCRNAFCQLLPSSSRNKHSSSGESS